MYKQYIRQAFHLLKDNRLLSLISILGTALAIAMIMCLVLIFRARTANYEPEVNRDRTLVVLGGIAESKEDEKYRSGGWISLKTIKDCFYPLTTAEAVTAISPLQSALASTPGGVEETKCSVCGTDDNFWKIFQFRILSGKPYGEEYLSGEKKAVVSKSVARRIYGTDDVVGRILSLSFVDYTICAVVDDVSLLAERAYSEVWVPYTTLPIFNDDWEDGLLGSFQCCILAPDKNSFDDIRKEVNRNVERMNVSQEKFKLDLVDGPDTQLMTLVRQTILSKPDVPRFIAIYVVVIIILLLVPAINLSGITLSRMRKRMPEIGIRRTFGATRGELMWQVLSENFVLTLIGGVVGLIFSYFSILGLREWLLNTNLSAFYGVETMVSTGMMISPGVFLCALLFCLLMNLLSAGIPAWKVSRTHIIDALK